jgi:hypothetical protein
MSICNPRSAEKPRPEVAAIWAVPWLGRCGHGGGQQGGRDACNPMRRVLRMRDDERLSARIRGDVFRNPGSKSRLVIDVKPQLIRVSTLLSENLKKFLPVASLCERASDTSQVLGFSGSLSSDQAPAYRLATGGARSVPRRRRTTVRLATRARVEREVSDENHSGCAAGDGPCGMPGGRDAARRPSPRHMQTGEGRRGAGHAGRGVCRGV